MDAQQLIELKAKVEGDIPYPFLGITHRITLKFDLSDTPEDEFPQEADLSDEMVLLADAKLLLVHIEMPDDDIEPLELIKE